MDVKVIMQSLMKEINSTKDRVRNLIGESHWPSDGLWKESIIRSVLRRYLPSTSSVGTGFVMTEHGISTQIDVIIYDTGGPILFRDGDFVVVTPDITAGIIEVKTRLATPGEYSAAIRKITEIAAILRRNPRFPHPFIGLYIFENENFSSDSILSPLRQYHNEKGCFEIQCICLGTNQFVRFWKFPPNGPRREYNRWHLYNFENLAPGYFIHNVIECLFPL